VRRPIDRLVFPNNASRSPGDDPCALIMGTIVPNLDTGCKLFFASGDKDARVGPASLGYREVFKIEEILLYKNISI